MREAEANALRKFTSNFTFIVGELENYSQYLKLGPDANELKEDALGILRKKVKKIEKAESLKDLKKVIKVNKILEKEGF